MKRFFAAILASLLACHAPAYAQPYPHQPQSDGLTATGANGGVISGQAFINWFASPPCIGCTTPGLGVFSDRARSLQSFGARGDGVTDDTAAFQTALNSGIPLICQGTVKLTRLVTVTNVNAALVGGSGVDGCTLLLTTNQSMVYFTETGNALRTSNKIRLEHIKVIPQTIITNVTGAPHTAAFDIEYPFGTAGTVNPDVYIHDVQVQPSAHTNYILNGVYINDVQTVHIDDVHVEGNRNAIDPTSNAIVINGTHAPTTLTIEHVLGDYLGALVLAPQVAATGFQGIRVSKSDCVFCYYGVNAVGSLDGTSDYVSVDGLEGLYFQAVVAIANVGDVFITNNYGFLGNPQTGTITNPVCYLVNWTITPPINLSPGVVTGNHCDGAQASGFIGSRIGVDYGGNGNTVLGAAVGPNMLSNLDIGVLTPVGTNGVSLAKQALRNVTTEWSNGAAPGNIQAIPPLWELLTVATLPACNAAAKGQQRQVSDAAAAPVYNATAAGGGTLNIMVLCNGTNWTNH
jgi:hypothetical protein